MHEIFHFTIINNFLQIARSTNDCAQGENSKISTNMNTDKNKFQGPTTGRRYLVNIRSNTFPKVFPGYHVRIAFLLQEKARWVVFIMLSMDFYFLLRPM
jgi:hypothetical protein